MMLGRTNLVGVWGCASLAGGGFPARKDEKSDSKGLRKGIYLVYHVVHHALSSGDSRVVWVGILRNLRLLCRARVCCD